MILERQTSGLVKQKVFIFLETLVEILKIIWDIFQKQMNFNLVWFPPTVTFPALRNSVSRSAAHIILLAFILARQHSI